MNGAPSYGKMYVKSIKTNKLLSRGQCPKLVYNAHMLGTMPLSNGQLPKVADKMHKVRTIPINRGHDA